MQSDFVKRDDGKCCVCQSAAVVTHDGLFCRSCLYKQLHTDYPDSYAVSHKLTKIRQLRGALPANWVPLPEPDETLDMRTTEERAAEDPNEERDPALDSWR